MTESERHNLDLLCVMESVCVVPFCGQKIDSRKVPQELLKKGIQELRFTCHNLYSQHCFWAIFWFLYSAVFWTGVVFVAVSRHSSGMNAGIIMLLCYLLPLFCHLISCFTCRLWRKSNVYQKLGNMNHQLSSYNCMATVRNSKFGTAFHVSFSRNELGFATDSIAINSIMINRIYDRVEAVTRKSQLAFFYYNISPCVDHLAGLLSGLPSLPQQQQQHNVFGMNQIAPQQPSTSEQQQQHHHQQQQVEFYRNYAKSFLMSYSAEYLYLFLDEVLPEVTSQRHTVQLCCLCQYVEYKTGRNFCNDTTFQSRFHCLDFGHHSSVYAYGECEV